MSDLEHKYANAMRYIKQLEEAVECYEDKESPTRLSILKKFLKSQQMLSYNDLVDIIVKKEIKIRKLTSKIRCLGDQP